MVDDGDDGDGLRRSSRSTRELKKRERGAATAPETLVAALRAAQLEGPRWPKARHQKPWKKGQRRGGVAGLSAVLLHARPRRSPLVALVGLSPRSALSRALLLLPLLWSCCF